jgi:hypothetical protein
VASISVSDAARRSTRTLGTMRAARFALIGTCHCGTVAVNAANFEPDSMKGVRIRKLDGASTWKFLE